MRHKILDVINDYEIALVVRNRYSEYVSFDRAAGNTGEGMFKNEFVDILKPNEHPEFHNKCDPNKKILFDERYDLKTIEDEYVSHTTKPENFRGLGPFELAEFRIVRSATLEALNIKKDEINSGGENFITVIFYRW